MGVSPTLFALGSWLKEGGLMARMASQQPGEALCSSLKVSSFWDLSGVRTRKGPLPVFGCSKPP